jgi:cell division inhibitor SepF
VATLARITTLQPRSYKEARAIGERYRDGVPVIMNLTELDVADAKRLVDFAAGLAFALRGSIDKVTNRVFLLTPADVEVSADDARKLAERGLFRQD